MPGTEAPGAGAASHGAQRWEHLGDHRLTRCVRFGWLGGEHRPEHEDVRRQEERPK